MVEGRGVTEAKVVVRRRRNKYRERMDMQTKKLTHKHINKGMLIVGVVSMATAAVVDVVVVVCPVLCAGVG